jgi:hypothetical protein
VEGRENGVDRRYEGGGVKESAVVRKSRRVPFSGRRGG